MGEDQGRESPLLSEYLRHLSLERGLALNTCNAYAADLRSFLKTLGARDPLKVSSDHLSEYLWKLRSEKKLKPASVFRAMEALRSFYRFQLSEDRIADDPTRNFQSPHLPERLPQYLSQREMQQLFRSTQSASASNRFEILRSLTALELLYATGMRVSEMLALKPQDVNLNEGWIRVFGKGSKERMVPLHDRGKATLTAYLRQRLERFENKPMAAEIFLSRSGRKLSRSQFWRDLKSLGEKAGLGRELYPHLLRHSFASHLLQGGADLRSVQELLGHANLTTTQIYTHLETSGIKSAHRKHHPRG